MQQQATSGDGQTRRPALPRTTWLVLAMLVLAPPMWLWASTGQVWEDFLITFRQSHNLVTGHGLTYQIGTRIHGFTSPLSVLVPALTDWLTRTDGFAVPLALYNVVALGVLLTGAMVLLRTLDREGPASSVRARCTGLAVTALMLTLPVRAAAFSVNGQEAGFWLGFLAITMAAAIRGWRGAWLLGGIGWTGLMWTRPDSPIHIAGFGIVALLFPRGDLRDEWKGLLKAAGVCTIGYLPWFLFAWIYYGSPIPHTVIAKHGAYSPTYGEGFVAMLKTAWLVGGAPFLPIYAVVGSWPGTPMAIASLAGLVIAAVWLWPRVGRTTRIAAFMFFVSWAYLYYVARAALPFPWYAIPLSFCAAVVLGRAAAEVFELPGRKRLIMGGALAITLGTVAYFYTASLHTIRVQQELVEQHVRREIGLWLRAHVKPDERVFLEPIGYIGWFSQAHILDYPGLVSDEVLQTRLKTGAGFVRLIEILKPEWLVLRPHEVKEIALDPAVRDAYLPIVSFTVRPELGKMLDLPGLAYVNTDAEFVILRRKAEATPRGANASPTDGPAASAMPGQ